MSTHKINISYINKAYNMVFKTFVFENDETIEDNIFAAKCFAVENEPFYTDLTAEIATA